MTRLTAYEGFPEGVTDGFCRHAAVATSQYGTTARALAAEVLTLRAERDAAETREHKWLIDYGMKCKSAQAERDRAARAEATLAAIRAWSTQPPIARTAHDSETQVWDTCEAKLRAHVLALLDAPPKETP
jgi:hypothetical protein